MYSQLLRLHSKSYFERFGEGMEQTFNDCLRERAEERRGLLGCALWMFVETSAGIIREHMTMIIIQHKNILRIALATSFLLLVPLVAMQFTDEVVWNLADFVVAGLLLFGAGLTYELVARNMGSHAYRIATGLAVATGLILIWVNLAVGLIGSEDNPANLMYFGVLAVGIIGASIGHFRPRGMARALFATALAQALVPVIALIVWSPGVSSIEAFMGMVGVFGANTFFVVVFLVSAGLFRTAAEEQPVAGAQPRG
jgi:hypothetical protein